MTLAIKHCKIIHFGDDTNLLITKVSPKRLNKLVNIDIRENIFDCSVFRL